MKQSEINKIAGKLVKRFNIADEKKFLELLKSAIERFSDVSNLYQLGIYDTLSNQNANKNFIVKYFDSSKKIDPSKMKVKIAYGGGEYIDVQLTSINILLSKELQRLKSETKLKRIVRKKTITTRQIEVFKPLCKWLYADEIKSKNGISKLVELILSDLNIDPISLAGITRILFS